MNFPRFHLAFPVRDLDEARAFYGGLLGCPEGRCGADWVDFNLYGHQIVAHLAPDAVEANAVKACDSDEKPVRHFGVILSMSAWSRLAEGLRDSGVEFLVSPQLRFQGEAREQATMYFRDPSGNAMEFKAFADDAMVFVS